jgi:hypothetical protein
MKIISLFVDGCTIATNTLAAELRKPESPTPNDALFDPSRVIQIEIRLDPKHWHALGVSHPSLTMKGGFPGTTAISVGDSIACRW